MAGGELASVMVRLTADASDFINGMDQATNELTLFAETAAGITAAGVAIAGTMTAAVESASRYETSIFNLSQTSGIATETLSALNLAAEAQGKTLDSVQVAFRKLGQEAEDALISPYSKAAATFQNLGVSLHNADGSIKDLSQLFPEVNEALSHVTNSTLKWGEASDLFGRSSAALLPVLAGGIEKMLAWKRVAEETGVLVTQEQAEQGKAFQLMQSMAENSLKGLAMTISGILMPSFMSFISEVKDGIIWLRNFSNEYPKVIELTLALGVALMGAGGLGLAFVGVKAAAFLMNTMFGETAATLQILDAYVIGTHGVLEDLDVEFAKVAEFMNVVNAETVVTSAAFTNMSERIVIVQSYLTGLDDVLQLTAGNVIILGESSLVTGENIDVLTLSIEEAIALADAMSASLEATLAQLNSLSTEFLILNSGLFAISETVESANTGFVILETSLMRVNEQAVALRANVLLLNGETTAATADLGAMGAEAGAAAAGFEVLDAEILSTTAAEAGMGAAATISGAALVGLGGAAIGVGTIVYTLRNEWAEFVTYIASFVPAALATVISKFADLMGAAGLSGLHDRLKDVQFSLEETSKDWADESEQFSHNVDSSNQLSDALKILMAQLKGLGNAHHDNLSGMREFDMAVKRIIESVTGEKNGMDTLTPALEGLMKLRVDDYLIVDKLGKQIIEYTNSRLAEGKSINAVLQYYRDLAINVNTAKDAEEKMFTAQVKVAQVNEEMAAGLRMMPSSIAGVTRAWEEHYKALGKLEIDASMSTETEASKRIHAIDDILAAENVYSTKLRDIQSATIQMKEAADKSYSDYYKAIIDYNKTLDADNATYKIALAEKVAEMDLAISMNASAEELAVMQRELDEMQAMEAKSNAEKLASLKFLVAKSLEEYKQYMREYEKLLKEGERENTRYWEQFVTTEDKAASDMEKSMANAMGDITKGFASALSQDIVHWKNWSDSLLSIAQNVAAQLLQAFLVGFLNPLTNALQGIGRSLSNLIFSAIGTGLSFLGGGGFGAGASDLFMGDVGFAAEGAVLDRDMPIFAHKGEMILPPDLSKGMQDMIHGNDGPSRLSPSDSAASMMPTVGPSMDSVPTASYAVSQVSPQMNNRTFEETNSILGQILSAIRQGQKIVVNGQVLGQTAARELRSRTLVGGAVAQAGR